MDMATLLHIDHDLDYHKLLQSALTPLGWEVSGVQSPSEAFKLLEGGDRFHFISTELHLKFDLSTHYAQTAETGFRTARELSECLPETNVIILSSSRAKDLLRLSRFLKNVPAFHKPQDPQAIEELFESCIQHRELLLRHVVQ